MTDAPAIADPSDQTDPSRPYSRVGARLEKRRLHIRMATSLLAEQLQCHTSTIQHVEAGRRLPTGDLLVRWAEALGVGADAPLLLQLQREDAQAAQQLGLRRKVRVVRSRILRPRSA